MVSARAQPRRLAAQRLEMRRGPFVGLDVARELLADAGAQHLDRDVAPVGGHRPVDLRDRGRADRFGIDARRTASPAAARSCARSRARIAAKGTGGRLSCRLSRLLRRLVADEIGPGGERLAELDRGRADAWKARGIVGRRSAGSVPSRAMRASRLTGGGRVGIVLDPAQRAVPRERRGPT